jgi:hypothetical protein
MKFARIFLTREIQIIVAPTNSSNMTSSRTSASKFQAKIKTRMSKSRRKSKES